ncbi:MAG: hypothetical protein IBX62_05095 [Coriobacteriia bacterium]|nr:hypothetical protein [Coriobacteriia bacterium]
MADWGTTTRGLTALLDEALADAGCERRVVPGGPAYTVNGHVFALVRRDGIRVLLPEDEETCDENRPRPLPGRELSGFVPVPHHVCQDPDALRSLVLECYERARSLPPRAGRVRERDGGVGPRRGILRPMFHDEDTHTVVERMLDHLFQDQRAVSRYRILQQAEAMSLPAEVLALFDLLPPGEFTRRRLVDQLNSAIVGHGMGATLGTFD